jgi:hypothetical protein
MHISLQIIIAALSVLGFYFCLKTLASLIFTSKHIAAAVMISDKKQLCELDLLIDSASSALFATRRRRISVFIPKEIWEACKEIEQKNIKELIESFESEFYII